MAKKHPTDTIENMNTPTWTFQDRLRKAREHAGMTQSELAEATGVSLNSLNRYEKGQRSPGEDIVSAIAKATGVPPTWLIDGDVPVPADKTNPPARVILTWQGDHYVVADDIPGTA